MSLQCPSQVVVDDGDVRSASVHHAKEELSPEVTSLATAPE
jgi:hypothetical protein